MSSRTQLSDDHLMRPATLDQLVMAGQGLSATVLRAGARAVKVAHPGALYRDRLAREVDLLRELEDWADIPTPRVRAVRSDGRAFVRDWVPGPTLIERLLDEGSMRTALPDDWLARLSVLHVACERFRADRGVALDFSPANLCWSRGRFVLVDGGERLDPSIFHDVDARELPDALEHYLSWHGARAAHARLSPAPLPPSGRFHVDVEVGRAKDARVLWTNRAFLLRRGIDLTDAQLHDLSTVATWAKPKTRSAPATRYQDGPDKRAALGDGRSLWVAQLDTPSAERFDCVLKGAGPTELAWRDNEFHFDGFVSFSRTLWEAAVCDELARLGFEAPEVATIASTGKTTVDNTRNEWPAAAALRLARTQVRLGHLLRWDDAPDEARALLRWAGARVTGASFDPERAAHRRDLVTSFGRALGEDIGRTDALCIHCFNPTMGNVRLDGHLIDFSTVRFHRFTLPDFVYMNERRVVKDHRGSFRRYASLLAGALRRVGLTTADEDARLSRRALSEFDRGYTRGYARGLLEWFGLRTADVDHALDSAAARNFVEAMARVRAFRADATLEFTYWNQSPRAPLFDVEALLGDFVRALLGGDDDPFGALRSSFPGAVSDFVALSGRELDESTRTFLGERGLARAQPRRWSELVRPFMEPERLATLCYKSSTPADFTTWKRLLSSSARLPRGRWPCEEAQRSGASRGHVTFEGTTIVGLTPELHDGLCAALEGALGARLKRAFADGSRVATRGVLCEGGADGTGSDALVVNVEADGELDEASLTRELDRLGCPFPVEVRAGSRGVTLLD